MATSGDGPATTARRRSFARRLLAGNAGMRALSYRDFRFLTASGIIAGATYAGENVALGWVVLEATDSPFMVGLAIGLRHTPRLLLGIPIGALADRFPRRPQLAVFGVALTIVALAISGLFWLDAMPLWALLALNVALGTGWTAVQALRQSMAYDIVGPRDMVSGLALTNLAQRLGAVLGGIGVGAVLAATDPATTYGVIAAAHVVTVGSALLIAAEGRAARIAQESVMRNLLDFLPELARNGALAALVLLTAAVEVLGFSVLSLQPTIARDVLNLEADGLGLIQSVGAVGGAVTVVFLAMMRLRRRGLVFLSFLLLFGAGLVVLSQSDTLAMVLAVMLVVNAAMAVSDVLSQGLMQAVVPNQARGRAAGAWQMAIGFGPIGNVHAGAVAALAGVSVALVANGGALFGLALLALLAAPQLRRL
ncbi:MAG: MFS transporter [Chloroflexota bacterium]|nr:MFS transporter [Chloroflexota bacterium]MDE2969353.1 MFS transporter [Chloroflexota bacterium]